MITRFFLFRICFMESDRLYNNYGTMAGIAAFSTVVDISIASKIIF